MKTPLHIVRAGALIASIIFTVPGDAGVTVSEIWTRRYNGPADKMEYPWSLAIDPSCNILITGRSWNGDGTSDAYTAKYTGANGAILWERRHDSQEDDLNGQKAMALDPSGNAIVAGSSNNGGNFDCRISKFAAADGSVLWERSQNTSAREHFPTSLAVGTDGSVVVACRAGEGPGFQIRKFAAADGTVLWQSEFEEPSGRLAMVQDLVLDAGGNPVATGSVQSESGEEVVRAAKYAAATGALLWETRWEPVGDYNWPTAVAIDPMGNVVVISISLDAEQGYHGGRIVKHADDDGSIIWENQLPRDPTTELTTHYDPMDVVIDGAGNVFMTSSMNIEDPLGLSSLFPVHTAKFAAADGALLWEQRHSRRHLEDTIDGAGGIALDSFGNVVMWGWMFSAIYAAGDGAILWESPADNQQSWPIVYSRSLFATGPRGMIAILGQVGDDFATSVYRQPEPPRSFSAWAAGFGLSDMTPTSDPDADGMPSAIEYVLGRNPTLATTPPLFEGTAAGQTWSLRFEREDNSETPDCTLAMEVGADLGSWPDRYIIGKDTLSSSSGIAIEENGSAPDTITLSRPLGAGIPHFGRLAVIITP